MEVNNNLSEITKYNIDNYKIHMSTYDLNTWNLKYETEIENLIRENNKCLEKIEKKIQTNKQINQLYENCTENLERTYKFISIIHDGVDNSKKYFLLRHSNGQNEINSATDNLNQRYNDIMEKQMSLKYVQEKYEAKEKYENLNNELENINNAIILREKEIMKKKKEHDLLTKYFIINMITGSADMKKIKMKTEQLEVDIVDIEKSLENFDFNAEKFKRNLTPVKIEHFQLSTNILNNLRGNKMTSNINSRSGANLKNEHNFLTQIKERKADHEEKRVSSTQINTGKQTEDCKNEIFRKPIKMNDFLTKRNEIFPKQVRFVESQEKISPTIQNSLTESISNTNKKNIIKKKDNSISIEQNKKIKIAMDENVENNNYVKSVEENKNKKIFMENVIVISGSDSDEKIENNKEQQKQDLDNQYSDGNDLYDKNGKKNNDEVMELDNVSNCSSIETITENELKNKNSEDYTNEEVPTDSESTNSDLQINVSEVPSETTSMDFNDINISDNEMLMLTDNLSDSNQMESNFFTSSLTDDKENKKNNFFNF